MDLRSSMTSVTTGVGGLGAMATLVAVVARESLASQGPLRAHNGYVVGGIFIYAAIFAAMILMGGQRRIVGLAVGALGVAIGVGLMFTQIN